MDTTENRVVRFGIVGIGNMGSAHAMNLYKGRVRGGVLTAVCDTDPLRLEFAKEHFPEVARFSDHLSMFGSGLVDAVIIATPHYFHPPIAISAFESGLNVMTEKPAGVCCSAVLDMNRAAEKSGMKFGIMFNQRTDPLFIKAKRTVESGALGVPKRLSWIITNWYRTQSYYNSGSWRGTFSGEGGGVLLNQAPHNLDILQWIFGMPQRVFATCDEGHYHDVEVEDRATIIMDYANGAQAQFVTTTGEYPGSNRLEIVGDRGKLVIESGKITFYMLDFSEREYCFSAADSSCTIKPTVGEYTADPVPNAHAEVLSAFAMSILNDTPPIADGREGINMLTLANAAYLSSWTGSWVDLPMDNALFDDMLAKKRETSVKAASATAASNANGEISGRWRVNW